MIKKHQLSYLDSNIQVGSVDIVANHFFSTKPRSIALLVVGSSLSISNMTTSTKIVDFSAL